MDSQAVLTVGAAVVALTQIVKWGGLPDRWGPIAVLILALAGVVAYALSQEMVDRAQFFDYFAGWINVATSAAGVFGFTRASSAVVTRATAPPGGAGQLPLTDKPEDEPDFGESQRGG